MLTHAIQLPKNNSIADIESVGFELFQSLNRADSFPMLNVIAVEVVEAGEHGDDEIAVSLEPGKDLG